MKMQEKAAQLKQELDSMTKSEKHAQFKRNLSIFVAHDGGTAGGTRRFPRTPGAAAGGGQPDRPTSAVSGRRISAASNTTIGTEASVNDDARSAAARRTSARSPSRAANRDLHEQLQAAISRQNQLEEVVADQEHQVRTLSEDNERRQDSYMRREEQLKADIATLEDQLKVARGERPTNPAFGKVTENIKELHTMVVGKIEELLDAQATTLRAEEHGTLRRFASRLNELEAQVASERGTPSKSEGEWMERTMALRQELHATQEIAQVLDKKYQVLAEENRRLKSQFGLQEEDREYLIRQTVALKKENAALRNQVGSLLGDVSALTDEREELLAGIGGGGRPAGGGGGGAASTSAAGGAQALAADPQQVQIKVQRYEDVIDSLKRLLEDERRRTKQARAAHTAELQQRTQLQGLLRQCIEDVRDRRRGIETTSAKEQQSAERASARNRPVSARPPASASVSRPVNASPFGLNLAAVTAGPGGASIPSSGLTPTSFTPRRPLSAAAPPGGSFGARPVSAAPPPAYPHQQPRSARASSADGSQAGDAPAVSELDRALSPRSRGALVEALLTHEELLKLLFDRTFPGVTPHPPSDPMLDKMAAWQDQRDAQVAANAKVLAAARAGALPPSAAVRDATPGGLLVKEAAAKPWVLNVDAMMSQFLQGGGPGGGGAGAAGRLGNTR